MVMADVRGIILIYKRTFFTKFNITFQQNIIQASKNKEMAALSHDIQHDISVKSVDVEKIKQKGNLTQKVIILVLNCILVHCISYQVNMEIEFEEFIGL